MGALTPTAYSSSLVLAVHLAPPCLALEFDIQPWETDRPVPQSIIFFDAKRAAGDPQYVDVILEDSQRRNSTTLFERHDLALNSNAGFRIPAGIPPGCVFDVNCCPRMTVHGRGINS